MTGEDNKKKPLKWEATMFLDLQQFPYIQYYTDFQTRDPKTGKLGKEMIEPVEYDFTYDSHDEETWPSILVTLKTTDRKLVHKFEENRLSLKGYKFKLTLEEVE